MSVVPKKYSNSKSFYKHLQNKHSEVITGEKFQKISFKSTSSIKAAPKRIIIAPATTDLRIEDVITPERKDFINFICTCGFSFNSASKRSFKMFLHRINPNYKIPNTRVLRMDINLYAGEIQLAILRALRNKSCSILTDGGTNNGSQFYPIILFTPQRLYFFALPRLEKTTSKDIIDTMIPFINQLKANNTRIISCCTDNCSNVRSATANTGQNTISQVAQLPILRIPCEIHSSLLFIADIRKDSRSELSIFFSQVQFIISKLHDSGIKQEIQRLVPGKVPIYEEIKWMSISDCLNYILKNEKQLNAIISKYKKVFGCYCFPTCWREINQALEPFTKFIKSIQKDNSLLYEFYHEAKIMTKQWKTLVETSGTSEQTKSFFKSFLVHFKERFRRTCDGLISKVAFLFTPERLESFRKKYHILISSENYKKTDETKKLYSKYTEIKERFFKVARFFKLYNNDFEYFFHWYLTNFSFSSKELFAQWKDFKCFEISDERTKKTYDFDNFAEVIINILNLPASEAAAERAFSQLKYLVPVSRSSTEDRMIMSQMIIRMNWIYQYGD